MEGGRQMGWMFQLFFFFLLCLQGGGRRSQLFAVKLHQPSQWGKVIWWYLRDPDVGKNVLRVLTWVSLIVLRLPQFSCTRVTSLQGLLTNQTHHCTSPNSDTYCKAWTGEGSSLFEFPSCEKALEVFFPKYCLLCAPWEESYYESRS